MACWSLSPVNNAPSNTDPYPGPCFSSFVLTNCTGQFSKTTFTLLSYRITLDFFLVSPQLSTHLPVTPFVAITGLLLKLLDSSIKCLAYWFNGI